MLLSDCSGKANGNSSLKILSLRLRVIRGQTRCVSSFCLSTSSLVLVVYGRFFQRAYDDDDDDDGGGGGNAMDYPCINNLGKWKVQMCCTSKIHHLLGPIFVINVSFSKKYPFCNKNRYPFCNKKNTDPFCSKNRYTFCNKTR